MTRAPKKVADRIQAGIKRFQPIIGNAKSRDLGESDTVTIVVDVLAEVFGYDKYLDITSEYAIRGTFCDLAIKLDGELRMLIEVKAIGLDLKDAHHKQAVDYAANQGVEWVALTNGIVWRIYRVSFGKPIETDLVNEFSFVELSSKSAKDLDALYLLCKEGWQKSVLGEYHTHKQLVNRFFVAGLLRSDAVLQVLRREMRRVAPDARIDVEELKELVVSEVLKRDVVEGDQAEAALRKILRSANNALRTRINQESTRSDTSNKGDSNGDQVPAVVGE